MVQMLQEKTPHVFAVSALHLSNRKVSLPLQCIDYLGREKKQVFADYGLTLEKAREGDNQ